jgi:hypothetical protein
MLPGMFWLRIVVGTLVFLAGTAGAARAQSPAEKLYQAYYLQHAQGNEAGAAKLYAEVAAARDAGADLQAIAKARLAECQEELAASDLVRLMPTGSLAYVELNRPGERVRKLLDQLGLLAHADERPVPGQNRLAISPALVNAVLGIRGAALAITGVDPTRGRPSGVLVLAPGDMEVMRGLLETALPAGATVLSPIRGFQSYEIQDFYVTLTPRLVIAGSSPVEIEGVLERLKDPKAESLATDPQLAEVLKDRHGELLFFCVNPQPLLPLLNVLTAGGAAANRQVALAQALLDPQSLRALSGGLELGDEGLALHLTLRLAEDHHNLVYNFLRRPPIDKETLRCVPSGAAALLTFAMNAAPAQYPETGAAKTGAPPIVTALDIGREIFANINGVAIYALPPSGTEPERSAVPDLAATITVNDPAKSQALWAEILGLASLASGGPTLAGEPGEVAGTPVRSYPIHHKMTVYEATLDHYLFSSSTTFLLLLNGGRCAQMARPFLPPEQAARLEPVIGLLANTTGLATIDQSEHTLRLSAGITGVPDVGPLVGKMLTEQHQRQAEDREVAHALRDRQWERARALVDRKLATSAGDAEVLRQKFDILVRQQDMPAAQAAGEQLAAALNGDARGLNDLAWFLMTDARYGGHFNELALRLARRSNELTDDKVWAYVDTLALAEFEAGNAAKAIELEQKAIELSERTAGGSGLAEMQKALRRFQSHGEKEATAVGTH